MIEISDYAKSVRVVKGGDKMLQSEEYVCRDCAKLMSAEELRQAIRELHTRLHEGPIVYENIAMLMAELQSR